MNKFLTANTIIPHKNLTVDEKAELVKIMVRGNLILKAAHIVAKRQAVRLQDNPRYPRNLFRCELFKALDRFTQHRKGGKDLDVIEMPNGLLQFGAFIFNNGSIDVYGAHLTPDDIKAITLVRFNEGRILAGHSKMVFKESRRWVGRVSTLEFVELYDESVIAAISCIYAFTKIKLEFSTFLQHSLRRKMITAMSTYGNRRLTNAERSLLAKYDTTQKAVEAERGGEPVGLEELTKIMGLTAKESKNLRLALRRVIRESDMAGSGGDDNGTNGSTAEFMESVADHREPQVMFDEGSFLNQINFTGWEKIVLKAYMDANNGKERGWQVAVAGSHNNPDTGKPYSRRAPFLALERAFDKIRAHKTRSAA